MNGKPRTYKDLFAFASRRRKTKISASGWQIVLIALLLALALGSAGQTPLAQAARPAGASVRYYMDVVNPRTTLCTGEKVKYTVRVYSQFLSAPPGWTDPELPDPFALQGVKVEANAVPESIGTFTRPNLARVTGSLSDAPNSYVIGFTAGKKPGKATLYFEGAVAGYDINMDYVSFNVAVKVINCKYKVTIVSKWKAGMTSVATMKGELKSDEKGYFTGSANVNWVTSILCGIKSPIAPSKADLTGTINESGQLVVKITFGPASSVGGGSCDAGGVSTSNSVTPVTLTITVAAKGQVLRKSHVVKAENGSFPGSATITVIPVEK